MNNTLQASRLDRLEAIESDAETLEEIIAEMLVAPRDLLMPR